MTKVRKVQTELSLEVQLRTLGVDGMDRRMERKKEGVLEGQGLFTYQLTL